MVLLVCVVWVGAMRNHARLRAAVDLRFLLAK